MGLDTSPDWLQLALVLGISAWLAMLSLNRLQGMDQRLMLAGLLAGLLFYSGIGAAHPYVTMQYTGFYCVFAVALVLGFHVGLMLFRPLGAAGGQGLAQLLQALERPSLWRWVIPAYLLLAAFPLFWPEWRVALLLAPQAPDLGVSFARRFSEEPDLANRLVTYARLLLMPFFFIALFRLRRRLDLVALVLVLLLYLDYTAENYIGRGEVMLNLGLLLLAAWFLHPGYRLRLALAGAVVLPLLVYGLYVYGALRLGRDVGDVSLWQALGVVLAVEWGFPRDVGMPLIQAGARVDLGAYFTWMATLPLPKLITGPIEGARVNYEISSLMLGREVGEPGWYVVLPGLVAEAVYLFGPYLFWLHALFAGGMAAFLVRLLERTPQALFLRLWLVLMLAYVLNRAGIGAVLPVVVNEMALLYLMIALAVWLQRRHGAVQPLSMLVARCKG